MADRQRFSGVAFNRPIGRFLSVGGPSFALKENAG